MGHRPEVPRGVGLGSAAGHEGDDDVGGVAVEVLASPVVDRGGSGVGVTGGTEAAAAEDEVTVEFGGFEIEQLGSEGLGDAGGGVQLTGQFTA